MTPDTENWLPVVGYEGLYEVSNHGRVRSLDRPHISRAKEPNRYQPKGRKGRMLKLVADGGYSIVTLTDRDKGRRNRSVHRLVLEAFVGPCPDGMECLHGDGDGTSNRVDNLRWGTSLENNLDRDRHGRLPKGEDQYLAKLTEQDVRLVRELRPLFSLKQWSKALGVTESAISMAARGTSWAHVQ